MPVYIRYVKKNFMIAATNRSQMQTPEKLMLLDINYYSSIYRVESLLLVGGSYYLFTFDILALGLTVSILLSVFYIYLDTPTHNVTTFTPRSLPSTVMFIALRYN